jgi:hypothetical protein
LLEGYGSYPYIKIKVQNTDAVNCRYDVLYSGNINSPDRSYPRIDPTTVISPNQMNYLAISPGAAGLTVLIPAGAGKVVIYGLEISNVTATQGIILQSTNGGGTVAIKTITGMVAGFNQLLPIGYSPYYIGLVNGTLEAVLTNATTVHMGIWYKVE